MSDSAEVFAFTGHRPQRLASWPNAYPRMVALTTWYLYENERPASVISGAALGWDAAAAWAAIALDIPTHLAVPFHGQDAPWSAVDRGRYAMLRSVATSVTFVNDGGYEHWKYHARNRWMVDGCTRLVALWDEGPRGGTAECVRYAKSIGRPVVNLWDAFTRMKP